MNSAKISILMPVFNVARFVAQAIESALGQTHSELELLIQDQGSIDGTQAICAWYAARDERIRILPALSENRESIDAHNALLAGHHGDYVAFLAGDDVCLPDRLERQLEFLRANTSFAGVTTNVHFTDAALCAVNSEAHTKGANLDFRTLLISKAAVHDMEALRPTDTLNCPYDEWGKRLADRYQFGHLELPLYCRGLHYLPGASHQHSANVLDNFSFSRLWTMLTKRSPEPITAMTNASNLGPPLRHTLRIAVHEGWGDFEDSLRFLTTFGDGRWGPVQFAPAATISDPDYHLVLNRPTSTTHLRYHAERLWFASGEPPNRAFRAYHEGQGQQAVVITCDVALVESGPAQKERHYILAPPMTRSWHVKRTVTELAAMADVPKLRCLSWVTSNITLLPGHDRRMKFLRTIRDRIPFDLYGRGFRKVADKWDGIAPYRYSIAFENHRSSHYFTEKVMDCFVCLTMPIYFGCSDLHRFFPAKSFVEIDPEDPHVIEKILEIISSDAREERLEALREAKWLVLEKHNTYAQLGRLLLEHDRAHPKRDEPMLHLRLRRVVPEYGAERQQHRAQNSRK